MTNLQKSITDKLINIENHFRADIVKTLTLPAVLYQYTDVQGLKGILERRKWRLTHYLYLNDGKEILYGDELIVSILEEHVRHEKNKWVKDILEETLSKQYGKPSVIKPFGYDIYLASFSEEGNLLDQWRAYASNGAGYSIGIKPNEIEKKIPDPAIGHPDNISFVKVEYKKNAQVKLIRKALRDIISFTKQEMKALSDQERKSICGHIAQHLGRMLLSLTAFFKHPAFHNEKEWRVVIWRWGRNQFPATDPEDFLKDVKFRDRETTLVPYIELDFSSSINPELLPLAEIILGPKHKNTQAKVSLEMFLQASGYGDSMPKISVSDIAYQ